MDLFTNLPAIEHAHENSHANEEIYKAQKDRLTINSWVLLFCMLDGQKVSSIMHSYRFEGMNAPKLMSETRKRIDEIKEFGIELMHDTLPSGTREFRIAQFLIPDLKAKYANEKIEVLKKLNK